MKFFSFLLKALQYMTSVDILDLESLALKQFLQSPLDRIVSSFQDEKVKIELGTICMENQANLYMDLSD